MAITLLELREQSRFRANQENSDFVTDQELNTYINSSIAELHDILVQSYGSDYFLSEYDFNTIADTDSYDLPEDFYKLMGVDARIADNEFHTLMQFSFADRRRYQSTSGWSDYFLPNVRYRVMGNQLRFTPTPDSAYEIKVWYTPVSAKLVDDTDELQDYNQFSEYVIVDAAIKMMLKEESDVSVLMAQKAELKRRIEEASQNRDAGNPDQIIDVHARADEYWYRR